MKTILTTITFLLITLSMSCNKDDGETQNSTANDNFIRAKIDGVAYEVTGTALHGSLDEQGFDLDSRNSTSTGMDFYIIGNVAVGTYNFSTANVTTQGRLNYRLSGENFTTGFCSVSNGTLTITAINGKTVEGTFSFMGSSMSESCATPYTKTITEGTFKITVP
jgi:hypothetical protein